MALEPLRVLVWAPLGAGSHYWGPGQSAYRLYQSAAELGVRADLAHAFPGQEQTNCFVRQICLGDLVRASRKDQATFLSRSIRWLHKHGKDYDVIHALSGYWYSLVPLALLGRKRAPVALKLTSSTGSAFLPRGNRHTVRLAISGQGRLRNKIEAIIALDSSIGDRVRQAGFRGHIAQVPNGVNTEVFHPRISAGVPADASATPVVLTVGGLMKRKSQETLIRALAICKKQGSVFRLIIVGPEREHGYRQHLESVAAALQIRDLVEFVDHVQSEERLADIYRAANIFALCSTEEGMSNALLEAMATGLPTIATNIQSNRSVVEHGVNGLLVPHTPEAFADGIRFFTTKQTSRTELAAAARAAMVRGHSHSIVWAQHEQLFRQLGRPRRQD